MADEPLDLDSRRGMAAQKATDIRSALAEVETHARELRERQAGTICCRLPPRHGRTRPTRRAKCSSCTPRGLPPEDARHRDLVAAILEDFARLAEQG